MKILYTTNEPSIVIALNKLEIKNLLLDLESESKIIRNTTANIKDELAEFLTK